ncbi:hypothetical protein HDU98_010021 [Podochytrium sp. JEL0797]|nr:hypothetical protein HDU98_010021 [Podochytrium sp. JEL0797]
MATSSPGAVATTTAGSSSSSSGSSSARALLPSLVSGGTLLVAPPPLLTSSGVARDVVNGLVFVSGGFLDPFSLNTTEVDAVSNTTAPCQPRVYVLVEATQQWRALDNARMPVGLCGHTLSYCNGLLWFVGGSTSVFLRTPQSAMTTQPPPANPTVFSLSYSAVWTQTTPSLALQRYNHVAEVYAAQSQCTLYVFGGQTAWLSPVTSNIMVSMHANSDGSASNFNAVNVTQSPPQPRTQSSSTTIISNFNHSIMLVYGGYTTSSTATSLSLSPLSSENTIFAYDMTNQTIASSYIVYFQPYNTSYSPPPPDPTMPSVLFYPPNEPPPLSALPSSLTSATLTPPSPTPTLSPPLISENTTIYPPPPPTYFSSLTSSTVLGPCHVDATNCLNFAFTSSPNQTFFYGGGQSNVSNSDLFWRLNTTTDGMWFWEDVYAKEGGERMPGWWDVEGFVVGEGVQFLLPYETPERTGGLILWNLTKSTFILTNASQPNVTDYYGQQLQPVPTPQNLPLILSISLSLAFLTITAATLLTLRHRRRRSRRLMNQNDPYLYVETHTPEPQVPPLMSLWQGSPLTPRRGLFLSTGEAGASAASGPLSPKGKAKLEESQLSAATLASQRSISGSGVSGSGGGGFEEIPLTTFTTTTTPPIAGSSSSTTPLSPTLGTQQLQQPSSRNRINAAWRVLTGVQPVSPGGTPIVGDLAVVGGGSSDGRRSASTVAERESLRTVSTHSRNSVAGVAGSAARGAAAATAATRPQFFRPPERTVTNAVVVVDEEGHDLPSYDAAMGARVGTPGRGGGGDDEIVEAGVVGVVEEGEVGGRQHAVVVGAHSPVGKDEIELRVGDHITLTPDATDTPHSSFTRGLNVNSGRTGLFPRHCITLVDDPAVGGFMALAPLSTDISWWREQAVRFNNALTNPASATGAAAVVTALPAAVVEGGNEKGESTSVPVVVGVAPPLQQQQLGNSIVAPLAPVQVPPRQLSNSGFVSPAAPGGGAGAGGGGRLVMDSEAVSVGTRLSEGEE